MLRSRPLLTVLVVWNVVLLGNAAVNVAEVVLAKVSLDAGNFGFGVLVGASGLGLTLGSLAREPLLERFGDRGALRRLDRADGGRLRHRGRRPNLASPLAGVVVGTFGNGAAVVCNSLLVQRGAPDELRGRAFTVIMSSNYVVLGARDGGRRAARRRVRRALAVGRRERRLPGRAAALRCSRAVDATSRPRTRVDDGAASRV